MHPLSLVARSTFDASYYFIPGRTQNGIPQQGLQPYRERSAYLKIQRILVSGVELLVPLLQHLGLQLYLLLHGL